MRILIGLVLFAAAAWLAGLVWFVQGLDQVTASPDAVTDAIVVLTGGSQRIEHGLALLAAGKGRKLFISGVDQRVDRDTMLHANKATPEWVACCVVLGHAAEDTVGNAQETAQWLRQEGYHSVRLVTANYHMRRALLEFHRVLPDDVTVLADPVFPEAARPAGWRHWRGTAPIVLTEYTKYLAALVRPVAFGTKPPPTPDVEGPS